MTTLSPQTPTPEDQRHYHENVDPHRPPHALSDIILGGQDGLVNVLGVILGVAAATQDSRIVLAAGLAATFAESVSMGAVAYTSTQADLEHYEAERERELRHIDVVPEIEVEEVREIFRRKGFEGELLETIVATITDDPDAWVRTMLTEEYRLTEIDPSRPLQAAWVVLVAALVGSLIPLLPFCVLSVEWGMVASLAVSAVTLFAVGYWKSLRTVGHPLRGGVEMMLIGMLSAMVGYGVGWLFSG